MLEPTCLALTFFDIPWLFFSATQPIFFYQYPYPTPHFLSTTLPTLTHSLSLALRHFFGFAATLVTPTPATPTPDLIISYDQGNCISLVVAESKGDFDFDALCGNHQRCVEELYPLVPPLASASLLSAQITIFSNAGICIAFAYDRVGADGRTFNSFIKTWASLCRDPAAACCLLNPEPPFYDRTVIKDTYALHSTFINHYYLTLTTNTKSSPTNSHSHNMPSYLGFNAGAIARLDYPVPTSYFGNCIGFARCMALESQLRGEDGIIFAANAIGNRVRQLDEAVLQGAENWISDWEVFYEAGHDDDVMVMVVGSPKLDFYDTDFGWGRPIKIEEISIDNYANAVSFTQSRHVRGGIEVGLALPKPKMDAFASFFTQIQAQPLELASS
ncbi:Transferase [Corchorus olitorius]|uniref:Transferase n=1 Tax=Corchorus olitorius TaxID=93759 RepID=A0A1R3IE12_9ROSI|nr:Transferase [Corchorus olitorius]